jgi:hypothetical protein
MTGTEELNGLMAQAERLGAKCYARIDGTALAKEGRTIIASRAPRASARSACRPSRRPRPCAT